MPHWRQLAEEVEAVLEDNPEPNGPKFGRQQKAAVTTRTPCIICSHCLLHAQDDEDRLPVVQGGPAKTYHCPCPQAPADVAANLTLLAAIAQRAPRQGFWEEGSLHLSALQRRLVAKREQE